jgi:(2Fe-2S) ferredoxin
MKINFRKLVEFIFVAITLAPLCCNAQDKPEQLILGKWRQSLSLQWIEEMPPKPKRHKTNVQPVVEFRNDGTWRSAYESVNGPEVSRVVAGTFQWVGNSRIEQTISESWFPDEIGTVLIKDVRVDNERLNLISVKAPVEPQEVISRTGKIKHRAGRPETSTATIFLRVAE